MQQRTNEQEDKGKDLRGLHATLAELWPLYGARYEEARSLWKSGKRDEGRQRFLALYAETLKRDALLVFDADFRKALQGSGAEKDLWSPLLRDTAKELVKRKWRPAVLLLARQCGQVEDRTLSRELLALALEGITDNKERRRLTMAAVELLRESNQLIEADRLLAPLLADAELSKHAALWRLAADLAAKREQTARELECLERALDAEYRHLPEVINVRQVNEDYGRLLAHYQRLAEAMVTLKVLPPADFLPKVVRAADRWRSLGSSTAACEATAQVLRRLGERELAWDYLTTPVGLRPKESAPWAALADSLRKQGDFTLADEALASAAAAEPTNAQLLWDRATNLRQAGRREDARKLLRHLADGTWQPRFAALQRQAQWQLGR
jgi:tetratricopeptide (TPR) repeat protein